MLYKQALVVGLRFPVEDSVTFPWVGTGAIDAQRLMNSYRVHGAMETNL